MQPYDRFTSLVPAGLACLLLGGGAVAQESAPAPPPAPTAPAGAAEPSPWYLGASQGFTHETNVYRVPNGPADTYSSTSVFGGFDQRISRQRVHGNATVALNRYFDEKVLDNTSYDFGLGLDWESLYSLSGGLGVGLRQYLAAPVKIGGAPDQTLNLGKTKTLDASVRWGGSSILSIDGAFHHASVDYSDETYASSETRGNSGSLSLWYGRGGPLRAGIGLRYDRTEVPKAAFDPIAAEYQSNTSTGKNVDLLLDYAVYGQLKTNARLSYTKQTNTLVQASDFSGWTGRIGVDWQATGRLALNAYASRDSGFDSAFGSVTFVPPGAPPGTLPLTRLYQNNRLTYAADINALYSATAKIDVSTGFHYARANLVSTASDPTGISIVENTDYQKVFYIGANYAFYRNAFATCRFARELRNITGSNGYSYDSNSIGCSARYVYR